MKTKLYTVRHEGSEPFDRVKAVKWYSQIMRSRQPFALAINSMVKGSDRVRHTPPYAVQTLRDQVHEWKEVYNRMVNGGNIVTVIQRKVNGRLFEVKFSGKNNRRDAVRRIKYQLREMRESYKRNNDPLAMRKPNGLLKEFQSKRLKLPKRPLDQAEYIGIEIECIMERRLDLTPLLPYSKWVEVGGDGSIDHHNNEEGIEVRVCMKREEVREVLPGIMQTLKEMGARINKSCGLHVHLDQRNNKEPEKVFQRLVRSLGLLYTVVPESRRRNKYCKRNRHSDFNQAVRGNRYKAINASAFHRYNTIEIRLFGGTLEGSKIINWIEVLTAISNGETVMRCPKTFDTALKYWKLSEENLAWLKERQTKFSAINVGMPVSEHETEANQMLLDETQDDNEEELCEDCGNPREDCDCGRE